VLRDSCQYVHGEEEEILCQDGHLAESGADISAAIDHTVFLDPGPRDIDIKQNQQNAQAQDAGVKFVVRAAQPVEEKMAVDLGLD